MYKAVAATERSLDTHVPPSYLRHRQPRSALYLVATPHPQAATPHSVEGMSSHWAGTSASLTPQAAPPPMSPADLSPLLPAPSRHADRIGHGSWGDERGDDWTGEMGGMAVLGRGGSLLQSVATGGIAGPSIADA